MRQARRAIVVVALTLVSCSSQIIPAATPTTNTAVLQLYATTPVIPLMQDLTTSYAALNPMLVFDVMSGNYAGAQAQVDQSYFVTNHLPADSPLWAAPIGQDGIAVIAHPDNPVTELTSEQLRDIYQGRVSNWREVGGADLPVMVISREDGSGTRAEFERLVMGDRRTTSAAQVAPSSAAMIETVAEQPGSIGYVSMSYLDGRVRSLVIDGGVPTLENVYTNAYPLRSTIFVVGQGEPEGDYRAFIAWVQSPDGQAVVAEAYAPLLQP